MLKRFVPCLMIWCMAVFMCASLCMAVDAPEYSAKIASSIPNMKLSIDCVIQKPVSEAELKDLGEQVYKENQGEKFKNVFIMWYLPTYKIGNGAWGTTNFVDGKMEARILKLQD